MLVVDKNVSKKKNTVLNKNTTKENITFLFVLQHLIERSWYAITETCLAFTVFRDDFNPKFIALFTLLLFLKAFHWLAEDRVDYVSSIFMLYYSLHHLITANY